VEIANKHINEMKKQKINKINLSGEHHFVRRIRRPRLFVRPLYPQRQMDRAVDHQRVSDRFVSQNCVNKIIDLNPSQGWSAPAPAATKCWLLHLPKC
jgi:hypothetical protein